MCLRHPKPPAAAALSFPALKGGGCRAYRSTEDVLDWNTEAWQWL